MKWESRVGALLGVLLLAVCATGCREASGAPNVSGTDDGRDGIITGTVRGREHLTPLDGRVVEVVNIDTHERHRARTDTTGTFSLRVKAGKYRVDLPLRDGETLLQQPGVIHLARPDAPKHVDFRIGTIRVSRPRGPAYRTDDGLGSPIA